MLTRVSRMLAAICHRHQWKVSDNTDERFVAKYPKVRTCLCGAQQIYMAPWQGTKTADDGRKVIERHKSVWCSLKGRR
jgi:hypothetical protein